MGSFFEFIFGNLFLIIIIISGIVGFISNNKEEEKKKERPLRPAGRQSRPATPSPSRSRSTTGERRDLKENDRTKPEPKEQSVMTIDSDSDAIGGEQQAQMERLQRKFGGVPTPSDAQKEAVDAVRENGIDLEFIKRQQLEKMENVSKELSEQQKVLKKDIRGSLRKKGLINGIIMAEVLGSPRALKPYKSVTSERYRR